MKSCRHPDVQHICEWSGKKVSSEAVGFFNDTKLSGAVRIKTIYESFQNYLLIQNGCKTANSKLENKKPCTKPIMKLYMYIDMHKERSIYMYMYTVLDSHPAITICKGTMSHFA